MTCSNGQARTELSERHSATAERERSASELSETWLNEVNKVPASLPGRVAEVVLSCGRLFSSSAKQAEFSCGLAGRPSRLL